MNARRLEHYEVLLNRDRARIIELLNRMAGSTPSADSAPGDDAGAGSAGVAPEDDDAVIARETAALHEIDEALHLLHESPGDYGLCERCGRPIPDERLELLPATKVCGRVSSFR